MPVGTNPLSHPRSTLDTMTTPPLSFTAIDFETANGKRASTCGIGMVKVRDGATVGSYNTLIRPPRPFHEFHPANIAVHHITAAHVTNSPEWHEITATIDRFTGDDVLIAHNAPFDMSVLTASNDHAGTTPRAYQSWCSLAGSRSLLHLSKYRLPVVADALGVAIPGAHHDPVWDCRVAAAITLELARLVGATTIGQLAYYANVPITEHTPTRGVEHLAPTG